MKSEKSIVSIITKTMDIIVNILLLFALTAAMLLFFPRLLGYNTYTVLSSSMEPTLPTGSLIYTSPYSSLNEIEPQDIIAYKAGQILVAHRVMSIDQDAGTLITKGDSNKVSDEQPVYMSDVIGAVEYHIPILGYILVWAQEKTGRTAICFIAALLLALYLLPTIMNRETQN